MQIFGLFLLFVSSWALGQSTVTRDVSVNGPSYWGGGLILQCTSGTPLGQCLRIDNDGTMLVKSGVTFAAGSDGRVSVTGIGQFVFATDITSAAVSGFSDTGHIAGPAIKNGGVAFNFPIGDGTRLGMINISAPNATDAVQAQFTYANPIMEFGTAMAVDVLAVSPNQYWQLQGTTNIESGQATSAPSVSVTLTWSATNILPASIPLANVIVAGWNGNQWVNLGGTSITGNVTAGSVTTAGTVAINNYTAFALAAVTADPATSTLTITTDNQTANGFSQDVATVTLRDTNSNPVSDTTVTFAVGGSATLVSSTCMTNASGTCTVGITSSTAGGYAVTTTTPVGLGPQIATFVAEAASTVTSALSCAPVSAQAAGAAFTCTATVRDASNNPVSGTTLNLASTAGSTVSESTCTADTFGICTFTVTSPAAGSYAVTAQLATLNIGGSPAIVIFTAPIIPVCIANPNPAEPTEIVMVTCTGGTPGDTLLIPGCLPTAQTVPANGTTTCTGTGATLGNNPPLTVTNTNGVTNTNAVLFQMQPDSSNVNPPSVPVCTSSPNPATSTDIVIITCTEAQVGTTTTIPGTTCTPNPATAPTIMCTGTTQSSVGTNPTVTTTDPATGLSNSSIVPLNMDTTMPVLPNCMTNPNPVSGTGTVTMICTGATPGNTLLIPGTNCNSVTVPLSGVVTCTGTGNSLGNNPLVTITDPTGNTTSGTVPMLVDKVPPAVPVCTATPNPAAQMNMVTVTCTVEQGTTTVIPGAASCTPSPATGTMVTCQGIGNALGSNPAVTTTDPVGNTSSATVPLQVNGSIPVPPAPPTVDMPSTAVNSYPPLYGTGVAGHIVTVKNGNITVCTAIVTTGGTWMCTPASTLAPGNYALSVTQTNPGNSQVSSPVPITISVLTRTISAPVSTGGGSATIKLSGGGAGCGFNSVQTAFVPTPMNAPATLSFPYGVSHFVASGCTPGSTITVSIQWPGPLTGMNYWKYGPPSMGAVPMWYQHSVTITGTTTTFTVTDGGAGDLNGLVDGIVIDPGGPARHLTSIPVPALDPRALIGLLLLILAIAATKIRQHGNC